MVNRFRILRAVRLLIITQTSIAIDSNPGPISFSTLDSYFIMPVQRVPRYVLLLNELQKTTSKLVAELSVTLNEGTKKSPMLTEDGEGRVGLLQGRKSNVAGKRLFYSTMQEEEKALDQAQKDVSIMAMRMNEAIRSSESWTQMRELQSKFVGSNVGKASA